MLEMGFARRETEGLGGLERQRAAPTERFAAAAAPAAALARQVKVSSSSDDDVTSFLTSHEVDPDVSRNPPPAIPVVADKSRRS